MGIFEGSEDDKYEIFSCFSNSAAEFYLSRSHLTVLGASEYSNILITAMTGMRPFEQTT